MRSVTQIFLLCLYFLLVFVVSRMLDMVIWYQHGIISTQAVDPLVLSVRQLKLLLQNRGVSYAGYVEKQELVQLVDASADLVQGEVDELTEEDSESVATPTSRFTGSSHLYEEIEDNKDGVWLVQVVPANHPVAPLSYDKNWDAICNKVAPFEIRTGIFHCKLDRKLCASKGWHEPMLLLALPKSTRIKDEIVLRTFAVTKPQLIMDWIQTVLSSHVKTIDSIEDVERNWLRQASLVDNNTSRTSYKDVKVMLLSHLFTPPLFLAALSIKFTGRVTFGIFTVKKEDVETVRKKLKLLDHRIPTYFVITPERRLVYGHRRHEHFTFKSMNLFLRAVQPEMNDVFLCTLVLVNMLVSLQIFQVSVRLWWKHVARCLWTVISYNFWLFATWLLILATYRFFFVTFLADKCLVVVRYVSLTEFGAILRADWLTLSRHPYLLFFTFFLYGWAATWLLMQRNATEVNIDSDAERLWWEVLPVDSHWINCFFRPMNNVARPLLASEVELEEGIDMLIERLAVPNLWLQPVIATEYIKNLPVWKHRGWDINLPKAEAKWVVETMLSEQETIEKMMDGEVPSATLCHGCHNERLKYKQSGSSPRSRRNRIGDASSMLETAIFNIPTQSGSRSPTISGSGCISLSKLSSSNTGNVQINKFATPVTCPDQIVSPILLCSSCEMNRLDVEGTSAGGGDVCGQATVAKDSLSSEESGDDGSCVPQGMRKTSECAVCLESYSWGTHLCGLPCGHSYHQNCIMAWLQRDNHHCPVCRWPAYKNKHPTLSHLHNE